MHSPTGDGGGGGGRHIPPRQKGFFNAGSTLCFPTYTRQCRACSFCYKIQDRTKTVSTQCRLRGCSVTMLGSPWQHHSAHFPSIWRPYVASGDIKIKSSHRPSANFYSRILIMSCLSSGPAQRDQNLGRGAAR